MHTHRALFGAAAGLRLRVAEAVPSATRSRARLTWGDEYLALLRPCGPRDNEIGFAGCVASAQVQAALRHRELPRRIINVSNRRLFSKAQDRPFYDSALC